MNAVKLLRFSAFGCERFRYTLTSELIERDDSTLQRRQIRNASAPLDPLASAVP